MDGWMPNYNYIKERERERERDGWISKYYIRYFHCIREREKKEKEMAG